ncbi:MAG: cytochrome c [Deltaproteobacteria bacterium]|nr:cytochrome c [Deltaproteobacteria bacterium]
MPPPRAGIFRAYLLGYGWLALVLVCLGCEVERRRTDAELGLNAEQASGHHIYEQNCERCHSAYSSHGRQGPSLQAVFKKPFLSASGLPANDRRVGEIIRLGRNKMEGFGATLSEREIQDLLAYLHTL